MIKQILNPKYKKIEYFLSDSKEEKRKNKYNFNSFWLNQKNDRILKNYIKQQEELNTILLNFNLQIIPIIIKQEYEMLQLQNYMQVENKTYLYELLYQGLSENFLEFTEMLPIIEAFYITNRITEKQYKTLIEQQYFQNKEYEDND